MKIDRLRAMEITKESEDVFFELLLSPRNNFINCKRAKVEIGRTEEIVECKLIFPFCLRRIINPLHYSNEIREHGRQRAGRDRKLS